MENAAHVAYPCHQQQQSGSLPKTLVNAHLASPQASRFLNQTLDSYDGNVRISLKPSYGSSSPHAFSIDSKADGIGEGRMFSGTRKRLGEDPTKCASERKVHSVCLAL
eukprot:251186-Amphidinium_carterae.1